MMRAIYNPFRETMTPAEQVAVENIVHLNIAIEIQYRHGGNETAINELWAKREQEWKPLKGLIDRTLESIVRLSGDCEGVSYD